MICDNCKQPIVGESDWTLVSRTGETFEFDKTTCLIEWGRREHDDHGNTQGMMITETHKA